MGFKDGSEDQLRYKAELQTAGFVSETNLTIGDLCYAALVFTQTCDHQYSADGHPVAHLHATWVRDLQKASPENRYTIRQAALELGKGRRFDAKDIMDTVPVKIRTLL